MNDKGISNLTGLEDFPKLDNLWVNANAIKNLYVSRNPLLKFVFAENNGLFTLVVSHLAAVEKLMLSINELYPLNLTDNIGLQLLGLKNNSLISLDVTSIPKSLKFNIF